MVLLYRYRFLQSFKQSIWICLFLFYSVNNSRFFFFKIKLFGFGFFLRSSAVKYYSTTGVKWSSSNWISQRTLFLEEHKKCGMSKLWKGREVSTFLVLISVSLKISSPLLDLGASRRKFKFSKISDKASLFTRQTE